MCSVRQGLNPATLIAPLATMIAPAASGCARTCRFAHAETACAKPMHNKDFGRTDSEGFSAHSEPSRTPAAHARWRPASWSRLCEVLDRILAGVLVWLAFPNRAPSDWPTALAPMATDKGGHRR